MYLEPIISQIFPVHLLNGFANAGNVTVLQEGILWDPIHFLDVNVLMGKQIRQHSAVGQAPRVWGRK